MVQHVGRGLTILAITRAEPSAASEGNGARRAAPQATAGASPGYPAPGSQASRTPISIRFTLCSNS
jgi:hypothetical protein